MAEVITLFPAPSALLVDEDIIEPRRVILELEHEIAELQHVLAKQALQFYRRSAYGTFAMRWWLINAAFLLLAFSAGWELQDPVSELLSTPAQAADAHVVRAIDPANWPVGI